MPEPTKPVAPPGYRWTDLDTGGFYWETRGPRGGAKCTVTWVDKERVWSWYADLPPAWSNDRAAFAKATTRDAAVNACNSIVVAALGPDVGTADDLDPIYWERRVGRGAAAMTAVVIVLDPAEAGAWSWYVELPRAWRSGRTPTGRAVSRAGAITACEAIMAATRGAVRPPDDA